MQQPNVEVIKLIRKGSGKKEAREIPAKDDDEPTCWNLVKLISCTQKANVAYNRLKLITDSLITIWCYDCKGMVLIWWKNKKKAKNKFSKLMTKKKKKSSEGTKKEDSEIR